MREATDFLGHVTHLAEERQKIQQDKSSSEQSIYDYDELRETKPTKVFIIDKGHT